MRIKSIVLSWFRGAANSVSLEPNCRSMVVYGLNGSGKSSFVDAIEYVCNNGKIGHLTHEYSGKHQERAIPNTHKPKDQMAWLKIALADDTDLTTEIKSDGSSLSSGAGEAEMNMWEYRRTVLRQNEVANFIHETKGGKYSALLPLLGLHEMEVAAENLRQLAKEIDHQPNIGQMKATLKQADAKRTAIFGTKNDDEIIEMVETLHTKYCTEKSKTKDAVSRCNQLEHELNARFAQLTADERKYLALQGAASLSLKSQIDTVRAANDKLASVVEPLLVEKLEVLESARTFLDKLEEKEEIACPACGRTIATSSFQAHVRSEHDRLRDVISAFNDRKTAIGALSDTVKSLKTSLGKAEVKTWRENLAGGAYADNFLHLGSLDGEALRSSCQEEHLEGIEGKLLPLIAKASSDSKDAPPSATQLSSDKSTTKVAKESIESKDQAAALARAEALVSFVNSLEKSIRDEIRLRSKAIIDGISADIRDMWSILHPGEAIENIYLYVPKDTDKAIDIRLKFYGVDQDSPRLTLSEGNRNSL